MANKYNCTPNGCSGGITWFYTKILNQQPDWECCCDTHDQLYIDGGNFLDRFKADNRLRKELISRKRYIKAWLFFVFIRLCGWAYFHYNGNQCIVSTIKHYVKKFRGKLCHKQV